MLEEIKEKNYVDIKEIDNITIVASKHVIKESIKFLNLFCNSLEIDYKDVLEFFGLINGKFTKKQVLAIKEYLLLEKEHEKQIFLNKNQNINIDIIEKYKNNKEEIAEKLNDLPSKLISFILNSNEQIENDFINILVLANKNNITKEMFDNSDITLKIELFIRIFLKPQKDFEQALFLRTFLLTVKETLSLFYTKTVKKLFTSKE